MFRSRKSSVLSLFLAVVLLVGLLPMASVAGAAPLAQGESYTVQKDDSLWLIAEKYLGNGAAYPAIVDATNKKATEDATFATIVDPSVIQPGWKIYIPSAEEAAAIVAVAPAAEAPDPNRELDLILVQHALCAWDSWWCTLAEAVEQAEKDLNVNVTILGPDEFDLEKTASLIDQAVAAQPDGISLTVTDPVLFKEPIMRALDAGIPVMGFNAGSGPIVDGIPYMAYLGQDEYQGGYLGGLRMAAAGGTKAVCVNHQVGHTGLDARCQGLVDAFAENGLETEVLPVVDDPAESQTIIDDYYTANPDTDTFLTLGPNSANPFYAFMEAAGLGPGDVVHGTFDLGPEIVAKIEDGTTLFGIDQQPYLQGYLSVLMLTLLNRQNLVPALPVTPTGPGFVDLSNVAVVKALAGTYR